MKWKRKLNATLVAELIAEGKRRQADRKGP